jgi:hypothetical protein
MAAAHNCVIIKINPVYAFFPKVRVITGIDNVSSKRILFREE